MSSLLFVHNGHWRDKRENSNDSYLSASPRQKFMSVNFSNRKSKYSSRQFIEKQNMPNSSNKQINNYIRIHLCFGLVDVT